MEVVNINFIKCVIKNAQTKKKKTPRNIDSNFTV